LNVLIFAIILIKPTHSDFVYKDFNQTAGLDFNGVAGTTNCFNFSLNNYGDFQGKADRFNEKEAVEIRETTVLVSESSFETSIAEKDNAIISMSLAGFLNRNDTVSAPTECFVRARLTPSGPSKAGSFWFVDPAPVTNGFDTYFTFQITDHSKLCTVSKDQYFSLRHHETCSIHGADGFAFVIQNHPNSTSSIGEIGAQMGFGGIENSFAIAFDTWQNQGYDSLHVDHISFQSRGIQPNDALENGLLGVPRPHSLADGKIHLVRITYYGTIQAKYLDKVVASQSLLPYLKDNGEQKRIGMLVVFIDDGVEKDEPIMAMPINLSLLLNLVDDKAYVGFTASTGCYYEKHDILSWVFCDQEPCDDPDMKKTFDYHQKSKFSSVKLTRFEPGEGYGGEDVIEDFPTENLNPDTTPWVEDVSSFSSSRNNVLSSDASNQIPPNTIY